MLEALAFTRLLSRPGQGVDPLETGAQRGLSARQAVQPYERFIDPDELAIRTGDGHAIGDDVEQ